jgi:hypothetical protein
MAGAMALVKEVEDIKKDFVEGALMAGIRLGDSNLIRFANATLNRDRGYGPTYKIEGEVNHTHKHLHALVSPEDLIAQLDEDTAIKVVEALQRAQEKKKYLEHKEIIDQKAFPDHCNT